MTKKRPKSDSEKHEGNQEQELLHEENKEETREADQIQSAMQENEKHPDMGSEHGPMIDNIMIDGEKVEARFKDIYMTNYRVFRTETGKIEQLLTFFTHEFKDIPYRFLSSIEERNSVDIKLFGVGVLCTGLWMVITSLNLLDGASFISDSISTLISSLLIGLGVFFLIISFIMRHKYLLFRGFGGGNIKIHNYTRDEAKTARQLQKEFFESKH